MRRTLSEPRRSRRPRGPGIADIMKEQQAEWAKRLPAFPGIAGFIKAQYSLRFGQVAKNQTQPTSAAAEASDQTPGADGAAVSSLTEAPD